VVKVDLAEEKMEVCKTALESSSQVLAHALALPTVLGGPGGAAAAFTPKKSASY